MHPVLRCCTFEHDNVVLQLLYLHRSADEVPCRVRSMPLSATATALAPTALALAPAALAPAATAAALPLSALPQPQLLRQQTLQRRHLGHSLERRLGRHMYPVHRC